MAAAHDDGDRVHAESAADWAAWLERHHERREGVWLTTWRPRTGKPVLGYEDAVVEALRFGWIDSKARRVDESRTSIVLTPRKYRSNWSGPNRERVERLVAADLMAPAGLAAIERAKVDGTWGAADET